MATDQPTLNVTPDRLETGHIITVSWEHQGVEGHLKMTTPAFETWYGASGSGSLSIPATVAGPVAFELRGPERKPLRVAQRKSITVGGESIPTPPQAPPSAAPKRKAAPAPKRRS